MKEKGFTLIELLAVIVILAIIALIATPLILNTIDTAKKGAFKSTAYGLIQAAEQEYYTKQLNGIIVEETTYEFNNGVETITGNLELVYKGQKPRNGTIVIRTDGKVGVAIDDGTWCAKKDFSEEEVTVTKKSEDTCTLASAG